MPDFIFITQESGPTRQPGGRGECGLSEDEAEEGQILDQAAERLPQGQPGFAQELDDGGAKFKWGRQEARRPLLPTARRSLRRRSDTQAD